MVRPRPRALVALTFVLFGSSFSGLWSVAISAAPRAERSPAAEGEPVAPAERSLWRYRLDNGLRVVLDPDRSSPTAVTCMTYWLGSVHDPEGSAGTAWLLAHLVASGATARGSDARRELDRQGASVTVEVGPDETRYKSSGPASSLPFALDWHAAGFEKPALGAVEFANRRRDALSAHPSVPSESATARAERRLRELAFQGHWPFAHAVEGSPEVLLELELEALARLHASRMRRELAVLSVVGNFDRVELETLIRQKFGARARPVTARRHAAPNAIVRLPRQTSERFNASVEPSLKIPVAHYAWPIPGVDDPAYGTFELLAQLLAGAEPSGWQKEMLDRGVAVEASAQTLPQRGAAAFIVKSSVDARSSIDKARTALEQELARLARSGPAKPELELGRTRLRATRARALENPALRAELLARHELFDGDALQALRDATGDTALTATALRKAVRRYLAETSRTSVELYPRGWAQDPEPEIVHRQHVVKAGEVLGLIAKRYGSSVEAIAEANRIRRHRFIFPGQKLAIPIPTREEKAKRGRRYVVKRGDSLSVIAQRHGVSTAALAHANGRTVKQRIVIGEALKIPAPPRAKASAKTVGSGQRRHRVVKGDTLLGLAERYGVTAASIASANGRSTKKPIRAGEVLVIPKAEAPRKR